MPTQFKESREECYAARDKYWECLDLNNDEAEKCVSVRKNFEKFCSKQWVLHFDRKRKFEKYKLNTDAKILESLSDKQAQ